MPRRTQRSMVTALSELGLHFRQVEVASEGNYTVADADWNYKDVPHLNQIHGLASNVNGMTEPDAEASLNLQKVLGIRMPVVLSHYDSGPDRHTYFFTLLMYVVICDTSFERISDDRTRVVTNYAVGSSRFWMLAFPLVSWVLRRNYAVLMSEDLPMRDRRGELRRWGYSFKGDGQPRNFLDSLPIERDNVVVAPAPVPDPASVPTLSITEANPLLWGRSDHLGLRIDRVGAELRCFPRMCPHEGARLDTAPRTDGCLECPWHGRHIEPLGRLRTDRDEGFTSAYHRVSVADGRVVIRAHGPEGAPPAESSP